MFPFNNVSIAPTSSLSPKSVSFCAVLTCSTPGVFVRPLKTNAWTSTLSPTSFLERDDVIAAVRHRQVETCVIDLHQQSI